jgi:hypothetical protein
MRVLIDANVALDVILERQPWLFAGSPIVVLSPAELLAQLPKDDHA